MLWFVFKVLVSLKVDGLKFRISFEQSNESNDFLLVSEYLQSFKIHEILSLN